MTNAQVHFHIRDGEKLIHDDEGMDFPDLEAAQREAQATARDLVAQAVKSGHPIAAQVIEITDDNDALVGSVRVLSVLP
jgi:hypothetical protein